MADYRTFFGRLLATVAVLYCIVQWVGARSMEGNRIFSPHEQEARRNTEISAEQLLHSIKQICTAGLERRIVFDDNDFILPYILSMAGESAFNRCTLVRETNVTLLSEASNEDCRTIRVREFTNLIGEIPVSPILRFQTHKGPWKEISHWTSPDNDFGFALFRRPACLDKGAVSSVPR
jgi:hypothetical protein